MNRSSAFRIGESVLSALLILEAAAASAQAPRQRTYANPIDIDYKYNFEQHNEGISYRSAADPVIVVQRGRYYLLETIGEGYWESLDLGTWRHITPTRWALRDIVAPAPRPGEWLTLDLGRDYDVKAIQVTMRTTSRDSTAPIPRCTRNFG